MWDKGEVVPPFQKRDGGNPWFATVLNDDTLLVLPPSECHITSHHICVFGVGNLIPPNWDPVNHQYIPFEDAWNPETQQYEFPWAPGQYNLEGLPHHHPQHPEDWEPGDPLD